jgi:hypothetical protein
MTADQDDGAAGVTPRPASSGTNDQQDDKGSSLAPITTGPNVEEYHASETIRKLAESMTSGDAHKTLLTYALIHQVEASGLRAEYDLRLREIEITKLRRELEDSRRETAVAQQEGAVFRDRLSTFIKVRRLLNLASTVGAVLLGLAAELHGRKDTAEAITVGIAAAILLLASWYSPVSDEKR